MSISSREAAHLFRGSDIQSDNGEEERARICKIVYNWMKNMPKGNGITKYILQHNFGLSDTEASEYWDVLCGSPDFVKHPINLSNNVQYGLRLKGAGNNTSGINGNTVTNAQRIVLDAIKELGRPTVDEIAEVIHRDRSTVTVRIRELFRKEMIARDKSTRPMRVYLIAEQKKEVV